MLFVVNEGSVLNILSIIERRKLGLNRYFERYEESSDQSIIIKIISSFQAEARIKKLVHSGDPFGHLPKNQLVFGVKKGFLGEVCLNFCPNDGL